MKYAEVHLKRGVPQAERDCQVKSSRKLVLRAANTCRYAALRLL